MKMEFKLLLTLLFAIFFVGCKSYEEVNNLKLYDFEDYINKEIKVYEVKFYCGRTFLDSFFKKADKSISLTCVNPKKYRWDIPRRSEHKLEWFYCIEMRDD